MNDGQGRGYDFLSYKNQMRQWKHKCFLSHVAPYKVSLLQLLATVSAVSWFLLLVLNGLS